MFIYNRKPPYFMATHKSKINGELFISVIKHNQNWISRMKLHRMQSDIFEEYYYDSCIKHNYDSSDKIWN